MTDNENNGYITNDVGTNYYNRAFTDNCFTDGTIDTELNHASLYINEELMSDDNKISKKD